MNEYVALRVEAPGCNADYTDLLAAFLADIGYESFEPDADGLTAYIPSKDFSEEEARQVVADMPFAVAASVSHTVVDGKDWNEEWEKNYFKPIVVDGRCVIHSTFHKDVPEAEYDIVINPKMAFGTGHHFTTRLIIRYLLESDLGGKAVIDVGTGTGILAILAHMRGAGRVDAIEIDPPAYENALEHTAMNGASAVNVILGDASALEPLEPADFLLANINRNVILGDIKHYASRLRSGGTMILSGFFTHDIPVLLEAAAPYGLELADSAAEENWAALRLCKK